MSNLVETDDLNIKKSKETSRPSSLPSSNIFHSDAESDNPETKPNSPLYLASGGKVASLFGHNSSEYKPSRLTWKPIIPPIKNPDGSSVCFLFSMNICLFIYILFICFF
jgi:hypothetical protein